MSRLAPGDCVILQTVNSTYKFWVEFPLEAIGVLSGGSLCGPTRVRLAAEGAHRTLSGTNEIAVGDRAHTTVLDPHGAPLRTLVTSTIAAITLVPSHSAAA